MEKLKLLYKLSPILLAVITAFAIYIAIDLYKGKIREKIRADIAESKHEQYKLNNNAIKQLEINLTEIVKNGQTSTDNLRNDVDNGLVELRVKVESMERDSSTASNTANTALQLARTARQDYFNLTNGISYNKAIIEGWQEYYCTEIAPKNNTEFMCEQETSIH